MTDRYSIANAPQLDEATIMVSLGETNTYETFETMLLFLAGKMPRYPYPKGGLNVALNGEDVNVVDVNADTGIEVRPPLTENWDSFGPSKLVPWEDIQTILIF